MCSNKNNKMKSKRQTLQLGQLGLVDCPAFFPLRSYRLVCKMEGFQNSFSSGFGEIVQIRIVHTTGRTCIVQMLISSIDPPDVFLWSDLGVMFYFRWYSWVLRKIRDSVPLKNKAWKPNRSKQQRRKFTWNKKGRKTGKCQTFMSGVRRSWIKRRFVSFAPPKCDSLVCWDDQRKIKRLW